MWFSKLLVKTHAAPKLTTLKFILMFTDDGGTQEVYTGGLSTPLQLLEGTRRLWLAASIRLGDIKIPLSPSALPQ